ncbi:MAG: HEAT repeat domain-containing protein [Planctomycetes bacterium]|nr:HEAT repeat domain-containing protein [Planctomycetota bacterium]
MSLSQDIYKDLAGSSYPDLIQNKGAAFAYLSSPNRDLRVAAINVFATLWNKPIDPDFVNICRTIAASDPIAFVRIQAIEALGPVFQSSRDESISQFFANLVNDPTQSLEARQAAYWALREVQLGVLEVDQIKRLCSVMKLGLSEDPNFGTENEIKRTLLCGGHFPESVWDSADEIEWDFVNQFVTQQ